MTTRAPAVLTIQEIVVRQGDHYNDNDDVAIMMMVVMIWKMVRMMTTPMTT